MSGFTAKGEAMIMGVLARGLAGQMVKIVDLHSPERTSNGVVVCRQCQDSHPCDTVQLATELTTSADF